MKQEGIAGIAINPYFLWSADLWFNYCIAGFFEGKIFMNWWAFVKVFPLKYLPEHKTLFNIKCIPSNLSWGKWCCLNILKLTNVWKIIIQTQGKPLAQTIPPSRIDAINDSIKPVVDTIMDKGKFQLQQTIYPCKCGNPAQQTLLRKIPLPPCRGA